MNKTQKRLMLGCIFTNLIAANLYLYITGSQDFYGAPGTPNYHLMIGGSIACVFCYFFLFAKIRPSTRNGFLLWLLSLTACVVIAMIGNTIGVLILFGVKSVGDFFLHILAGLVMGFIGSFLFFQFIIPISLINLIWLVPFAKNIYNEKMNKQQYNDEEIEIS